MNLIALKVKGNAKYICQECGATELIQAHHIIPHDDNSLVCLCAECHSKKHPNMPKSLFFNKLNQPYWHNKSASSIAREVKVHPRTIIRLARRLQIPRGELSSQQEDAIRDYFRIHPMPIVEQHPIEPIVGIYTVEQTTQILGFSRSYDYYLIAAGLLKATRIGSQYVISREEIERYKNTKEAK